MHRPASLALVAILSIGCGQAKTEPVKAEPAKTESAKTEPAKTEPAKTEPAKTEPALSAADTPKPAPPLTAEELELIAADPAELTPEFRRKRAFALRKKIMQHPESEAAKALEDMRRKVESGEVTPQLPSKKLRLDTPPGHPPSTIPEGGATKPAN